MLFCFNCNHIKQHTAESSLPTLIPLPVRIFWQSSRFWHKKSRVAAYRRTHAQILLLTPCFPTVLTKYPSDQNSPPQNFFFTWGQRRKISHAVGLFIIWTIFFTLYISTDCTKKWIWSLSVPISRNFSSYRFSISMRIFRSSSSTASSNTALLYFAGNTRCIHQYCYSVAFVNIFAHSRMFAASCGEQKPKWFNLLSTGFYQRMDNWFTGFVDQRRGKAFS